MLKERLFSINTMAITWEQLQQENEANQSLHMIDYVVEPRCVTCGKVFDLKRDAHTLTVQCSCKSSVLPQSHADFLEVSLCAGFEKTLFLNKLFEPNEQLEVLKEIRRIADTYQKDGDWAEIMEYVRRKKW